jgi:hypothetical protein
VNLTLSKDGVMDVLSVIGRGRLLLLGALLAFNLAFGALIYGYLLPYATQAQDEARRISSEAQGLSADIRKMRVNVEDLKRQRALFARIEGEGFFSAQDRKSAEGILIDVRRASGITNDETKIAAADIVRDTEAQKADYVVLQSAITSEVSALDDATIYTFLDMANTRLPGLVSLESFSVERVRGLDAEVLRAIRNGANPPLVNAKLGLVWHTMVPSAGLTEVREARP